MRSSLIRFLLCSSLLCTTTFGEACAGSLQAKESRWMICTEVHRSSAELYRLLLFDPLRDKKERVKETKEYRRRRKKQENDDEHGGIKRVGVTT